jgi:signal transduction histidine kinase
VSDPSPANSLIARLTGWPADVALAVVLAAGAVAVAVASAGWKPAAVLLALFMTLPVALRNRSPLMALAVPAVAHIVNAAAGFDSSGPGFIALVVALYTVSARFETRISLVAAAAIFAGTIYVLWHFGLAGIVVNASVVTAAWVVGRNVRTRRALIEALEDRARSLGLAHREEALRAAAEERARIARELHDVVAHSMGVIVVQAGAGRRVAATEPEQARDALATIEKTGREALTEMRRLLGVLRSEASPGREPQPGLDHVDELIDRFRAAGLELEVHVEGLPSQSLPASAGLSAYRILQEALTNCLKHAPGSHVRIELCVNDRAVELEVTDDGSGEPVAFADNSGGLGITGMRERVGMFGGELSAGPVQGGGWKVTARLPFEPRR